MTTLTDHPDPVQLPLPFEELERSFLEEGVPLSDQELDRLLGPPVPVPEYRARYYGADEEDGLIKFDPIRRVRAAGFCRDMALYPRVLASRSEFSDL